ncbi:MAG: TAXI family TRAP transporter solute-binding subunit, partial [Alphaproteobacteria bacterium]|nr:TAXI family TRAP transporter solute-binding subunit [Alphaproteobacteria bacterium]
AQSEPPEALAAVRQRDRGDMLVVGTGKVTGVYFPTGGAICQLFNAMTIQDGKNHDGENQGGANCTVTSTGGSIDNLNALRRGDLDFALVQSDWQFHAHEGTVRLAAPGAFGDLRALFSIYVEPLTIIARGDSGIRKLDDLPGTRVAMGEPGSGQYEGMKVLMSAMGWSSSDFDYLSTGPASGYLEDLCLGEVDAVVMVAGHPNGATMGITNSCDAVLVDVSGHEIDTLIAAMPYYAKATIPGGFYPGNPDPVASFGVAATVVAAAGLSEETVYALVRAVFENFDTFRVLHPAFNGLAARDMISRALSAPLHEGAVRYYRERGWL